MNNEAELELQMSGYQKQYDYSNYAHANNVNVIPEQDFKRLVSDTFKTIADILRATYGPYGSSVIISDQSQTTTTKDGYNVFEAIGFNHTYKRMVYLAISKIIDRVNRNVGDGTTSCILLAEKMFNNLNNIIKTPDDKRNILDLLTRIEHELQDESIIESDVEKGFIKPLTPDRLDALISMASNGDHNLTEVVYNALDPVVNEEGVVTSVRNVVPASEVVLDSDSTAIYDIDYLPGDYRIRANMQIDDIAEMAEPVEMKVVIYDHAFNSADWLRFKKGISIDDTVVLDHDIMILARTFTREFIEHDWADYVKQTTFAKKVKKGDGKIRIHLGEIRSTCVQGELKDLAAVLGTEPRGIHAGDVNHDLLPSAKMSIYKTNCLAFHDLGERDLSDYIEKLKIEIDKDDNHSYIKAKEMRNRIDSLTMKNRDTLLTVKCGTSLEAKLIMDKIDDCISIADSAINSGTVPNLLTYAYSRITRLDEDESETVLKHNVITAIQDAIIGLFGDIWASKYGDKVELEDGSNRLMFIAKHYNGNNEHKSFDIVNTEIVDSSKYPTSAQYDLEVVVAAISIVKYLLTGRALIFDAHILPAVNDNGHYVNG